MKHINVNFRTLLRRVAIASGNFADDHYYYVLKNLTSEEIDYLDSAVAFLKLDVWYKVFGCLTRMDEHSSTDTFYSLTSEELQTLRRTSKLYTIL